VSAPAAVLEDHRGARRHATTSSDTPASPAERRGWHTPTAPRAGCERLTGDEVALLVESAATGDRHAWGALVREFSGMVRAVARAHRLSEADAADVAQATWLKLFEHLDRISDPTRVGAWLATTARRECLRLLRGAHRQVLYGDDAPYCESVESPADDALLTAERDLALWRCFGRLRGTDQALLGLLLAESRPAYEEIAAALAMPIGSIGPTRARALDRLRRELDNEGGLALLSA
jgi:RNA polymerase sigma factor (sigma-70 family)